MTVRPEPNVDALAKRIRLALNSLYGETDVVFDSRPAHQDGHAALAKLAALARANTERDQLLHDATDALECRLYTGHLRTRCKYPEEPMCDRCALLARFRALTGTNK